MADVSEYMKIEIFDEEFLRKDHLVCTAQVRVSDIIRTSEPKIDLFHNEKLAG